jgi:hypothetical protein
MGTSSKPLHFLVHPSIAGYERFALLESQGHKVDFLNDRGADLILAPNAMRMTTDILDNLPQALDLAIKGARLLKHGPAGTWKKGVKGGVQNKKASKRKNTKIKAQTDGSHEPTDAGRAGQVERSQEQLPGQTSLLTGDSQAEPGTTVPQ